MVTYEEIRKFKNRFHFHNAFFNRKNGLVIVTGSVKDKEEPWDVKTFKRGIKLIENVNKNDYKCPNCKRTGHAASDKNCP